MALMPVATFVFLIRGEGLIALASWAFSAVAFAAWCSVRLDKSSLEVRGPSQPEV
jgi:hypothetical protein